MKFVLGSYSQPVAPLSSQFVRELLAWIACHFCKTEQLLVGHILDLEFARMDYMSASSEQILIGIDVSKATLDVALRGSTKAEQFANSEPGVQALLAWLAKIRDRVAVVLLEATGGLERHTALQLCLGGYAVMVVNPRQAHDFAKSLGYLSKTEKSDAQALAHFAYTLSNSDKRDKLLLTTRWTGLLGAASEMPHVQLLKLLKSRLKSFPNRRRRSRRSGCWRALPPAHSARS